jgi:tetratricopeptide (TPR) repeat protein
MTEQSRGAPPPLARFAEQLRELWLAAGKPSYRSISGQLHAGTGRFYSKSVIGDVLAGRRAPKQSLLVDLVGHLGGDPATWSARLTEVLRPAVVATPVAPAQIPHDIRDFTGREREVARARALLAGNGAADTGLPIVVIEGMAGTGKTRLAIHVAHAEKSRFDELQLYAELHGFAGGKEPVDPAAVLEGFLRQLGVPGSELPAGLADRAALYRARLDGRRAIVLLDDAASEEQVRPLLPGSPTCGVLVTSRRALGGLDGTQPLPLGAFPPTDSLALLERVVGAGRVGAEPAAAGRLAELCGHLPLAVALAARRLRSRPAWRLADLVRRLERQERRLAELALSDVAVRAVFELSYGQLDEPHRRLFRLLALHPGHDACAYAAAALTGEPVPTVAAMLETLLDEHLLEQAVPGRYRFHDLLRVFARDRLAAEEDPAGRAAAVRALLDWYLRAADQANHLLAPHRRKVPYRRDVAVELPVMRSYDQALAWCESERPALLAAVRLAVWHGHHDVAWQLPITLYAFFETRRTWPQFKEILLVALAAAAESGDATGEAWVDNALGIVHTVLGDHVAGRRYFAGALALQERLGDEVGVAQVLNNLGESYRMAGDLAAAIDCYHRDLAVCRRRGDRGAESISLNNLGKAQYGLGRLAEAVATQQEALAVARAVGDRRCEAEIFGDLAEIRRALGDLPGAAGDYERCGWLYDRLGDSVGALTALVARAELAVAAGDRAGAARLVRQVEQRLDAVEEPAAAEVRARLARL